MRISDTALELYERCPRQFKIERIDRVRGEVGDGARLGRVAHRTLKSSYEQLVDRLNRFPQGAAPSELLYRILKILFSEREAGLVALLPIKPFSAEEASRVWKMDLAATQEVLDELASRMILVDLERDGQTTYTLPPPMAGFFEFSMMRIRDDIDQKILAELFYQYMNVEEDFIKGLFTEGETQLGRVFVHEPVLSSENALHVLGYDDKGPAAKEKMMEEQERFVERFTSSLNQ